MLTPHKLPRLANAPNKSNKWMTSPLPCGVKCFSSAWKCNGRHKNFKTSPGSYGGNNNNLKRAALFFAAAHLTGQMTGINCLPWRR